MKRKPIRSLALHSVYTECGWAEMTHAEYIRDLESQIKCCELCGAPDSARSIVAHLSIVRDINNCPVCARIK